MAVPYYTIERAPSGGDASGAEPRQYMSEYLSVWTPNETLSLKFGAEKVACEVAARRSANFEERVEVREHGGTPARRLVAIYASGKALPK